MDSELVYLLAQTASSPVRVPTARMTYLANSGYQVISGTTTVPYNTVTFSANGMSTATGTSAGVTVPLTGYYVINAGVGISANSSGAQGAASTSGTPDALLYVYVGGTQYTSGPRGAFNNGAINLGINDTVYAAANSLIQIKVAGSTQYIYGGNGAEVTTFLSVTYVSS